MTGDAWTAPRRTRTRMRPPIGPRELVIQLAVSHERGDLGPDWQSDLAFPDHTARFLFRWIHAGAAIDRIEYRVYDDGDTLIARNPIDTAQPDTPAFFSIKLSDLRKRNFYRIVVQPLDENGAAVRAPSTPVTLSFEKAEPIPFMFASLVAADLVDQWNVPGLVGAVSCRPGDAKEWCAGIRKLAHTVKVQNGDLWHIGSDCKAMTATMVAKLIEDGHIDWDDTIWDLTYGERDLFPEVKGNWPGPTLHPRFQDVTLDHLASNRSGMVMNAHDDRSHDLQHYTQDPTAFRWEIIRDMLTRDHTGVIGEWRYDHGNFMLLSVIIERITGKSFEQTMIEDMFRPAGMTSARFGMPTDLALPPTAGNVWVEDPISAMIVDTTVQPNGHMGPDSARKIDNRATPPVWNASGGVCLSMADWLKFCRLQIDGRSGSFMLDDATLDHMHAPYSRADRQRGPHDDPADKQADPDYAWGWGIFSDSHGGIAIGHGGNTHRFVAHVEVYLDMGFVVATAANMGGGEDDPAKGGPIYGDNAVGNYHYWLKQQALEHCVPFDLDVLREPRTVHSRVTGDFSRARRTTRSTSGQRSSLRSRARRFAGARETGPELRPIEEIWNSFDPTFGPERE